MSFNALLIQLVLFSCLFTLLRGDRLPQGWRIISGSILLVLVGVYVTLPQWAGWISGGLWLLLVMLPLMGSLRVNRLFYRERYTAARQLANLLRWLHPADGWMEYPKLLHGLELGQQGHLEEARQILQHYGTQSSSTGRMATIFLYRMNAQWQDLLNWLRQNRSEDALFRDTMLATYYLRSLGETGDLNGLVQGVERFERQLGKSSDVVTLNLVRLYALAFCGQVEQVQQLLQDVLSVYSREMRQFWLATAEWAAGQQPSAREILLPLQQHSSFPMQQMITWRLSQPSIDPTRELSASSQQILTQLSITLQQETRYGGRVVRARKTYATYLLIGLNLLMFGLELQRGGSENLLTLYQLGALVPESLITHGEWWRLLYAMFLHYGWVHLAVNLIGLYVLGRLVEALLGVQKFLVAYFFCGLGSMGAIAGFALWMQVPELIAVGASGAIMGLLGVLAAILLKGWRQEKSQIAARRLRLVGVIVVLQTISDMLMPQVSLTGHLSGLVLGFLVGGVLFKVDQIDRRAVAAK